MTEAAKASGFISRRGAWVAVRSNWMTPVIVLGVITQGDWTRLSVVTSGGCFGVTRVVVLARDRVPKRQPQKGSELAQHGVYAQLRHSLSTSVMLGSLGWSLIWQSRPGFIAALVLIPFVHAKARREERWLREWFSGYADYECCVPRFIPRLLRPPNRL